MFSFLFGKPKKAETPLVNRPATSVKEVQSRRNDVMDTMNMLHTKESELERRIEMLEKKSIASYDDAKRANQAGQKEKAMLHLRKRAMYEDQLKTNNAMLLKIIQQRTALETTMINTGSLDAMNVATQTMKSQQTAWSSERVADLTDDMHEVMDMQREITDMIRAPVTTNDVSEDDLEAELSAMGEADLTAAITAPPVVSSVAATPAIPAIPTVTADHLPAVPSNPVVVAAVAAPPMDMTRELAGLE